MGSNDTAEQLAVCHEVNVANEARIATLDAEKAGLRARCDVLEAQIAELETQNTRLEGALRDRLTAAAHARPDAGITVTDQAGDESAAAIRMLAAIIRNLPAIPPERLDALAAMLTPQEAA